MHEFNLFQYIATKLGLSEHLSESAISILSSISVFILLLVVSVLIALRLRNIEKNIIPSKRFGLQNIMELLIEWLYGIYESILGEKTEKYFPLVGTLFIYILLSNLLGFIPGFMAPTTVITTNLACALVVFFYYNFIGIRERGVKGYFKHFLGPIIWLAPLFVIIEIISHIVRPISLSVRLFGNMVGDHLVLGVFSDLAPFVVPMFFLVLGLFVSFIQAFVFSILSTVYIALAVQD